MVQEFSARRGPRLRPDFYRFRLLFARREVKRLSFCLIFFRLSS